MKHYVNLVVTLIILSFGSPELLSSYASSEGIPDDYIVNNIKTKSNLTVNDIKRMKFLWLGFLTEPLKYIATVSAGTFFATKGYVRTQQYPEVVKNISSYIPGDYQPEASMVSNIQKWLPLSVGIIGAGVAGAAAYNFLYPRIHSGILHMVQQYANVCKLLVIAIDKFDDIDEMNTKINTTKGNATWATTNIIAKYNGIHNLIEQAFVAKQLCDLLDTNVVDKEKSSTNVVDKEKLCNEIGKYKNNLEHNEETIVNSQKYINANKLRNDEITKKNIAAMNAAQLEQIQAQAGTLQAGKMRIYWKIVSDVVKKSFSAAKYLYENQKTIMGFIGATAIGAYLQSKGYIPTLTPEQ